MDLNYLLVVFAFIMYLTFRSQSMLKKKKKTMSNTSTIGLQKQMLEMQVLSFVHKGHKLFYIVFKSSIWMISKMSLEKWF